MKVRIVTDSTTDLTEEIKSKVTVVPLVINFGNDQYIDGYDITVRGSREIELFRELISKANNFEIYPVGDEKIRFAIMFDDVLIHAPEGK